MKFTTRGPPPNSSTGHVSDDYHAAAVKDFLKNSSSRTVKDSSNYGGAFANPGSRYDNEARPERVRNPHYEERKDSAPPKRYTSRTSPKFSGSLVKSFRNFFLTLHDLNYILITSTN